MMIRKEGIKTDNETGIVPDRFATKARLNLNELLRRRLEEKKVDKKANLVIFSGAAAVLLAVLLILNL